MGAAEGPFESPPEEVQTSVYKTTLSSFGWFLDGIGPINDVSLALWTYTVYNCRALSSHDMSFDDKEFSCRIQTKTALLF